MTGSIIESLISREREFGPFNRREEESDGRWKHWRLAHDADRTTWLFLDRQDSKVNLLGEAVLGELGEILAELAAAPPRGLVLRSAKAAGFCAGADVHEFTGEQDPAAARARLEQAHAVADRLAELSCPTLAIIHGACLGGGLELALCCDFRLALADASFGLPEILLGLHPGLGGTARLPHLIDPLEAMTLMLTGRTIDARKAKKLGLVDAVIEERHVTAAVDAALGGRLERQDTGVKDRLLATAPARRLEARQMRAKSAAKAPPQHYPAPEALIDLWEEHGGDPEAMRREERRSFVELLATPTAQNLLRVFFLRDQLKKQAGAGDCPIRQLHVIGAGAMGGDIAGWCALKGLRVSLQDTDVQQIAGAVKRLAALCRGRHLGAAETRAALDRLIPDPAGRGIGRADLVLEAVPEKLALKQQVYRQVEPLLHPGALLASNTSSIPLGELAAALETPSRFVGLHFFNPVSKMQLVEVVSPEVTAAEHLATARAFVGRIGRLPVTVASAPGFLVNRVLTPYLLEAMALLSEKVAAETIDRAAEAFGMPMGPAELADRVGLDICLDVADLLGERLPGSGAAVPDWLREKVQQGELGMKSGRGLYRWEEGRPNKQDQDAEPGADLADRLVLPMLNAAMACLREQVVADGDLLDGAMIFGTGFAPFRGGPLHYARQRGFAEIRRTLATLAEAHGERFAPDPGWDTTT